MSSANTEQKGFVSSLLTAKSALKKELEMLKSESEPPGKRK
jgi:hypothetical protein